MKKPVTTKPKMSAIMLAVMYFASLAAIGYGLWLLHGPLCPLGVGLLVWVDLTLGALRK